MTENNLKNNQITINKTVGILGGGQLGMMIAEAGKKIGVKTICYCPANGEPAPAERFAEVIYGEYDDQTKLKTFAEKCDVISFEFENIPYETAKFLESLKPVKPNADAIFHTQHRERERDFFKNNNLPTHRNWKIRNAEDIAKAFGDSGIEKAVLKTSAFGYDGKGQVRIKNDDDFAKVWNNSGFAQAVLEEFVTFEKEISVVLARTETGEIEIFPIGENIHENGILKESLLPANISEQTSTNAKLIAQKIANLLNYVGVMAVEFFVLKNGDVLINEVAPRVHNSGHWTQDGCTVSQFEQHLRAVCGADLLRAELTHAQCKMINLIGDDFYKMDELTTTNGAKNPNAFAHDYGKKEVRAGRKMAHVNVISN